MNEELQYRKANMLEIRHAQRIIDLIAVPYNDPATVNRRGRWVTESIAPGAFAGVSGEVPVNRAHDVERPLGRVITFHPGDERGLRAELKISPTPEGNDVLELAEDGLLSPSVCFAVRSEEWNRDRTAVLVKSARLAHIGMTGEPAYKGARVLEVRRADEPPRAVSTPNLDRIRFEILASQAGFDLRSPQ